MLISLHMYAGLKYSESRTLYIENSQKVEKWIKILDLAFLKVTPQFVTWPAVIVSYITYFTTDLGDLAFQFPAPIW